MSTEPRIDRAVGDETADKHETGGTVEIYLVRLALAVLMAGTSFFIAGNSWVWDPSIPVALAVLTSAQMGVGRADRAAADRRLVADHVAPKS